MVLATSMPVTATRKEAVENIRVGKNGENLGTTIGTGKDGKNLGTNFIRVLFI